jgi:hypothetical protein
MTDCAVYAAKQEAIAKTAPPGSRQKRYQPPDPLLGFSRTSEPKPPNYAVRDGPGTPVTRAVTASSA